MKKGIERGKSKGDPHEEGVEILPSSIGLSTEGQHGLRATVEAAVITVFGDSLFCCDLGLRTRVLLDEERPEGTVL